jgi:hypothetical protein
MQTKNEGRAALAGTLRDPRMIDRLVGAIEKSPSTVVNRAATAAAQAKRPQIAVRRFGACRLTVGSWSHQRTITVVTVSPLILREVAR